MKKLLMAGLILTVALLGACSNNEPKLETKEDIKAYVQDFYNQFSDIEQESDSSKEDFDAAMTSFSSGDVSDKEFSKAVDAFQDTADKLADKVEDVKISSKLPDDIQKLLEDSKVAFLSAYQLKEQASQSAVSAEVTADQFKAMTDNADLAMLFGISKLNEARVATGLIDADAAVDISELTKQ
ncbi:hypothetical protein [Paenibacillus sp. sgz500958]|uniref:hypothetical protein n=1 Tax=Paenibacillus sp. sgz500958 TaxID=3242475 RepID=UPI0036D256B8